MDKLLKILKDNARLSTKELSAMLNRSEAEIINQISELEKNGIIKGYKTLINEQKINAGVTALIELKVTPKKEFGFQDIADRVMQFSEVESVYLMAGDYDLAVFVKGETIQDVAMFVSKRLAPLDSVISTATHFVLQKYKQDGVVLDDIKNNDIRSQMVKE
jgi:DNA-binding Lrp family transcriptional regulator